VPCVCGDGPFKAIVDSSGRTETPRQRGDKPTHPGEETPMPSGGVAGVEDGSRRGTEPIPANAGNTSKE
ncbi:hypothetical protein ABE10_10670, partial [Bacillus toyonensis]|nr:hypothetical protein [Bacillus toyonensis]